MALSADESLRLRDICNLALGKLGQKAIPSFEHSGHEATQCRLHLPYVRQNLLRGHAWNFATKFAKLEESTDLLDVEYDKRYNLPCDYMQLLSAWHDSKRQHRMESINVVYNRVLATDEEGAYIEYVADVCDPAMWDVSFRECVITSLASALAIPVFNSPRAKDALLQELHQVCLPDAHLNNAWEDSSNENNPTQQRLRESAYINQNNYIV